MYYYCFFLVSLVLYVWGYPHYILFMYWLIYVLLAPLVIMRADVYLRLFIYGGIPQFRKHAIVSSFSPYESSVYTFLLAF